MFLLFLPRKKQQNKTIKYGFMLVKDLMRKQGLLKKHGQLG